MSKNSGDIVTFDSILGITEDFPSAPPSTSLDSSQKPMQWKIFRYEPPSRAATRAWSHMFMITAPLEILISVAIAISSASSATAAQENSSMELGTAGSSAVVFGVVAALIMFVASVVAFVASQHAKAADPILPYSAMFYITLATVAELLLMASAISADVESERVPPLATRMTVLCVLDAVVAIPVLLVSTIAVTISMFLRHRLPTLCDD